MDWGEKNTSESLPTIVIDEFFGVISAAKFRDLYRIPAEIKAAIVVEQLKLAVVGVRRSLASWRRNLDAAVLDEVPQQEIGGTGELRMLFERACYCLAKAELLRETITVDRRAEAENASKSGNETEEKYREFAADAISMIVDSPVIAVESI